MLFFAHGFVLDQFDKLVAKHHRARGVGQVATDLEGLLVHLFGHAAVMQQIIGKLTQAFAEAAAAGIK